MAHLPCRGTGLDARAAAIVMRTVRNTVDTGRTVVCTIHQPSIDIFEVGLVKTLHRLRACALCRVWHDLLACLVGRATLPDVQHYVSPRRASTSCC